MWILLFIGLAALPPTLVALAALRQGQENEIRAREIALVAQTTSLKTEELLQATAKIHDLTNSNLTQVKADLAAALRQIKGLQELVAGLSEGKVSPPVADPAMSEATRLTLETKT